MGSMDDVNAPVGRVEAPAAVRHTYFHLVPVVKASPCIVAMCSTNYCATDCHHIEMREISKDTSQIVFFLIYECLSGIYFEILAIQNEKWTLETNLSSSHPFCGHMSNVQMLVRVPFQNVNAQNDYHFANYDSIGHRNHSARVG